MKKQLLIGAVTFIIAGLMISNAASLLISSHDTTNVKKTSGDPDGSYIASNIYYEISSNLLFIPTQGITKIYKPAICKGIATDNQKTVSCERNSRKTSEISEAATYQPIECGNVNNFGHSSIGNVTFSDLVYLISYMRQVSPGPPPIPEPCLGDVNCDGLISLGDVVLLINYFLLDGVPPCSHCCDRSSTGQQRRTSIFNSLIHKSDFFGNIMMVENRTAPPGMHDLVLYIQGSWDVRLGAYSMVMSYDPTKIENVRVSLGGTVAEDWGWKGGRLYEGVKQDTVSLLAMYDVSHNGPTIPPGSGPLFKVKLDINKTTPLGETDLVLWNTPDFPPSMSIYVPPDGTYDVIPQLFTGKVNIQWICGDVNADGIIDLADIIYLLNYLFKNGLPPVPDICSGDVNDDEITSVGDVVYLMNYLFKGGPQPVGCCS